MRKNSFKNKRGYTIIETMISISLFITVVMAGMGTLLQANLLHQKSNDLRSILDNLSFMMEEMSRNLRTGYTYHCGLSGTLTAPQNCASGTVIFFEEAHGTTGNTNDQWAYKIELASGSDYNLFKSIDSGVNWVQLNPTEVKLSGNSGFSVLGATVPPGNTQQPFVAIRLVGTISYKNISTPFNLQTSASQRVVDN